MVVSRVSAAAFMLQDARLFRREIVETAQQCVNTYTHTRIQYYILYYYNNANHVGTML